MTRFRIPTALLAACAVGALGSGVAPAADTSSSRGQTQASSSRSLQLGSSGPAVKAVQRRLRVSVTGYYGERTAAAVRRFQRRRGLAVDGVVGPATWWALGRPRTRVVLRVRRPAGGSGARIVRHVIAAANRIARKPYRYGGGHASFVDSGYDCSGSVSYALHGGGLLDPPLDSSGFMSYGAPGKGRWITIYANPGHVYMVVRGRRFDTTGRDETGSRWQWRKRSSEGYTVRHPVGF